MAATTAVLSVMLLLPSAITYRTPSRIQLGQVATSQADAVLDALPGAQSVVLDVAPRTGPSAQPASFVSIGLIGQLRLRQIEVRFPPGDQRRDILTGYRASHRASGDESAHVLVRGADNPSLVPPPGYRLVYQSPTTGLGLETVYPAAAIFVSRR